MITKIINKQNITREKVAEWLFWIAFLFELIMVAFKRFDFDIANQTRWMRVMSLLFCIKIVLTKHTKKEWIAIWGFAFCGIAAFYLSDGKDLLFRAIVMVAASKNISREKAFRYIFVVYSITFSLVIILGFLGIEGTIKMVADFGRGGMETRYCFGFSHPNGLHYSMWLLLLLGIKIFYDKMKLIHFVILEGITILLFMLSVSRTGFFISTATIILFAICKQWNQIKSKRYPYIIGAVIVIAEAFFSIYAVFANGDWGITKWLDKILTGRIHLANSEASQLHISLFSNYDLNTKMDMGYVKLLYEYGVIAFLLYFGVMIFLIRKFYRDNNYLELVVLLMTSLYILVEMHQISLFVCHNIILVLLLGQWNKIFGKVQSVKGKANERIRS